MGIQLLTFLRKRRLGRERQQKKERVGGEKETANDVLKCNSTFMKYSLPQTRLILKIKCPGICPSDFEALIYDLSKAANLMIHNRSGRNIAAPKGKSWERDGSAWPCRAWGLGRSQCKKTQVLMAPSVILKKEKLFFPWVLSTQVSPAVLWIINSWRLLHNKYMLCK